MKRKERKKKRRGGGRMTIQRLHSKLTKHPKEHEKDRERKGVKEGKKKRCSLRVQGKAELRGQGEEI